MNGPTAPARYVLSDSTAVVSFCGAGIGVARALFAYERVEFFVVDLVLEELKDKADRDRLTALENFTSEWPAERVCALDDELKASVIAAAKARQAPGEHEMSDIGELATVLYAAQRLDEGESFEILMDDRFGKELARDRGFTPITTPSLVVEMVCAGALSFDDGNRVWRQAVPRNGWRDYPERIRDSCPDRAPET